MIDELVVIHTINCHQLVAIKKKKNFLTLFLDGFYRRFE